ncbi:Ldh family oxidoreductase [Alphaproteobacteria bacterium]|nr:Ldh family oxidoreductase [Alphaproteobacteria bacterium]
MSYLSQDQARDLAYEKLRKSGCSDDNLKGITDGILDAELSGIKSHGFHYLPIYCNHLKIGKINGKSKVNFEKISNSAIKINADNGFAHSAINLGFDSLFDMCAQEGIASMSVYNSYNCGVLGFHTKRIAEKGFVGLGFTNAPASIAPVGGTKAVVGTNPFSLAVPLDGQAQIVIDQSASVVAKSEISVRAKTGESIPEGWAFDSEGMVTTNAQEALKGTMAPSGGYKGFGMGLLVEIFTACIAGGNLGTKASSFAGEDGGPPSTGQFFIAIDAEKFNSNYKESIQSLISSIIEQEGARLPGSKRQAAFQQNQNQDIEIADQLLERINQI